MDKRTATFIQQITNRFNQFNIVHQVMENDYNTSNSVLDEPFTCDYQISIWLQNNKLGHQDLYMYLNKKDDLSLVAVDFTAFKESQYDKLAEGLRAHLLIQRLNY